VAVPLPATVDIAPVDISTWRILLPSISEMNRFVPSLTIPEGVQVSAVEALPSVSVEPPEPDRVDTEAESPRAEPIVTVWAFADEVLADVAEIAEIVFVTPYPATVSGAL
jgi:hypothetical protein